jgi:N-acetylmuramoyl-L-alanine amidase
VSLRTIFRACPWLLAILLLSPFPHVPPAASAGSATLKRLDPDRDTRASRKSRAAKKPAAPRLIVVQDLRVRATPAYTRLVLDLQGTPTFTQREQKNPDRVTIELQNAVLGKPALAKIAEHVLPGEIAIAQANPRSVTVSFTMKTVRDYKLLPLTGPPRLAVDLFHRVGEEDLPEEDEPQPAAPVPATKPVSIARTPFTKPVRTIVVDAGHGGKDPGALGRSGLAEKDITLQVARQLRDLIAKRLGTQVLMTRERDVFVELEDRARFANRHDADLFISIHVNSHPQRATKGLEVYHFGQASDRRALEVAARENGTPLNQTGAGVQFFLADLLTSKKIEESQDLAWWTKKEMVASLNDHYDVVDHGVKTAPFYVLRFTSMPSILTEIAFITNPTEERLMRREAFLSRMAEAIFEGVRAFIAAHQPRSALAGGGAS